MAIVSLLITFLPMILVIRYWYLETGNIWVGAIPFAVAFGIEIVERLSAERRIFEDSWMQRPAIIGPSIVGLIISFTIGHWLESPFWGMIAALVFVGSAIHQYKNA